MSKNKQILIHCKGLTSKEVSVKAKLNLFQKIIIPIMTYTTETLAKKNEYNIEVMERKILRPILGPRKISEN